MHFEARARLQVTPEALWPFVSDTQRMNRAMGLPLMKFTAEPLPTGGSRMIGEHPFGSSALAFLGQIVPLPRRWITDDAVLGWLPSFAIARWVEHPFEFQAPRRYTVLREYFYAPLGIFPFTSVRPSVELMPLPGSGTEVVASADVVARNPQGALMGRLVVGPKSCSAVIDQCRKFELYLQGKAPHPFPDITVVPAAGAAKPAAVVSTADAYQRLTSSGVDADLATLIRRHLERAPDEDVLKMRPFELADAWQTDRRTTLVAFLRATTVGLTEMTWEVLCPGCRVPKFSAGSIGAVQGEVHCTFCNISFDATIDRQVEVRFSVAEGLRKVEDRRFCSGGPMNIPHVITQAELAPGESRTLAAQLDPGTYRLRSLQSKNAAILEVTPESPVAVARVVELAPESIAPPSIAAPPGEVTLELKNSTDVIATLVLENPNWPDTAATASVVSTMQEFRDLFDSEVLAPGLQLAIQRLAFLFTDLTGSTAMYQKVGQARAFRLVQDHFKILFGQVEAHRGAVVKTIGDAVMAAFPTGADAVKAAVDMQRAVGQLDTGGAVDPKRFVKIGIHEGPCIAVTANGRLDYFGTTVNTASRVEHECRGGQIVMTIDVYQDPAAQEALAGLPVEDAEATLRGISEPVQLRRVHSVP